MKKNQIITNLLLILLLSGLVIAGIFWLNSTLEEEVILPKDLKENNLIENEKDRELEEELAPIDEETKVKTETEKDLPQVSIIIDDLGNSFEADKKIAQIDAELTLAVLPFREDTKKSLDFFADKQEIILHLPLEPSNQSQREENMLTVDMSQEEIIENFHLALDEMRPYVSGINNHKGSHFTSSREAMETLLREVKKEEMFFVDSFTIASSIAFSLSKEMGVETARRDVFLDGQRDTEYIKARLYETVSLAESRGQAIAIGHVFPETIEVLQDEIPKLKSRINFVNVSNLLE